MDSHDGLDLEHLLRRPYLTAELPGIGGEFKQRPDDFIVEEIPAYEPSGEGQHLYVWVEKRGVDAMSLLRRLARHFDVPRRDMGMAGMKDKHAVTRQWISLPAHLLDVDDFDRVVGPVDDDIEVLEARLHRNKLRTGHLHGNIFSIRLRAIDLSPVEAEARVNAVADVLRDGGVPNYFGLQRFGNGLNTLRKGLEIVRRERRARSLKKRLRRLALHAVQSAIFNRVLALRIERDLLGAPLLGDRVEWHYNRKSLLVEEDNRDTAIEELREHDGFLTGPMPGPKMLETAGPCRELEREVYDEFDIDQASFEPFDRLAPGTRRALTVKLSDFTVDSDTQEGETVVNMGFSLPTGSYATVVLREFVKEEN